MNELVKPTLQVDLDVEIPKVEPIKHNLNVIEDYALQLKNFYAALVFDDTQYKQAKDERAKVNGLIKKIADNRKDLIKQYNEPISDFEQTSKRIEKLLGESSSLIDESVKKFEFKQQEIKREHINELIEKEREEFIASYSQYEKILKVFDIEFDNRWFNKTFKDSDIVTAIKEQFLTYIKELDVYKKDAETISNYFNALDVNHVLNKDVYIERYKYTRDVNGILESIKNDLDAKNKEASVKKETVQIDPFAGLSISTPEVKKVSVKLEVPEDKMNLLIDFAKVNNMKMEVMKDGE
jgi:hypothetical protein|nr:MAG TPA: Protein of unknown function (DUF1351) [Caudoviricetes sp.]